MVRKVEIGFGRSGYRRMLEEVGRNITEDKVYRWLMDVVKEKIGREIDEYEGGIDVQVRLIAKDICEGIKEGKVFDRFYVFYYPVEEERAIGDRMRDRRRLMRGKIVRDRIGMRRGKIENPPPALRSLAQDAGISLRRAERYWKETKEDYLERTGKSEEELTDRDYQYIMGVVKKRMGLPVKKVS